MTDHLAPAPGPSPRRRGSSAPLADRRQDVAGTFRHPVDLAATGEGVGLERASARAAAHRDAIRPGVHPRVGGPVRTRGRGAAHESVAA